jgi:hypothetical protein
MISGGNVVDRLRVYGFGLGKGSTRESWTGALLSLTSFKRFLIGHCEPE